MINIIDYIMQARRTIVFLMIIIISTGSLTYINIAKDAEPDIDIPFIYVVVPHQGISPEDSERLIVKPLENQLKTIEGIEEMNGSASNGFGSVLLEFDINFDKDKSLVSDFFNFSISILSGKIPEIVDSAHNTVSSNSCINTGLSPASLYVMEHTLKSSKIFSIASASWLPRFIVNLHQGI